MRNLLSVLVAITILPLTWAADAQTIYKCPRNGGGFEYTDIPCTGPSAEVVHQATSGEVADKLHADDYQAMLGLLRNGQVTAAQQYAVERHEEWLYNQIVEAANRANMEAQQENRRKASIARIEQAEAAAAQFDALQQQNARLRGQVNAQAAALDAERNRADAATADAQAANAAAQAAQNQAMAPKFDPQTGMWCQQIGGTLECH